MAKKISLFSKHLPVYMNNSTSTKRLEILLKKGWFGRETITLEKCITFKMFMKMIIYCVGPDVYWHILNLDEVNYPILVVCP